MNIVVFYLFLFFRTKQQATKMSCRDGQQYPNSYRYSTRRVYNNKKCLVNATRNYYYNNILQYHSVLKTMDINTSYY